MIKPFFSILLCLVFAILLFFLALDYWSLKMEVHSYGEIIGQLQAEQRPLVIVNGRYPYVRATRHDLLIDDGEGECEGDCGE